MNSNYIISQLETNMSVFSELFNDIPEELIHWRNQPGKWNLLEIACHLYDEEREDFRARLKSLFVDPSQPFVQIDPVGWVIERKYDSRDLKKTVSDFIDERSETVKWLRSLKNPPYNNAYQHPKVGPVSARLILANWLAHDYLHFRQITRVKYDYIVSISGEKMDYAGTW